MSGPASIDFRRTPLRHPLAVGGQPELPIFGHAVDHNAHIHLAIGQQAHGKAAYGQIEPVAFHWSGAVGKEPLYAAGWLQQTQLGQAGEEVLMVIRIQRLAESHQSGYGFQSPHFACFVG